MARSLGEDGPNGFKSKSTYEKLLHSLQCDHRIQWELALGKRIGFYSLRGELGSGNFSRVRAGIHTLTKGENFKLLSTHIEMRQWLIDFCMVSW